MPLLYFLVCALSFLVGFWDSDCLVYFVFKVINFIFHLQFLLSLALPVLSTTFLSPLHTRTIYPSCIFLFIKGQGSNGYQQNIA